MFTISRSALRTAHRSHLILGRIPANRLPSSTASPAELGRSLFFQRQLFSTGNRSRTPPQQPPNRATNCAAAATADTAADSPQSTTGAAAVRMAGREQAGQVFRPAADVNSDAQCTLVYMLGSQFCIKVLAALRTAGVTTELKTVLVLEAERTKYLHPPYLVPAMVWHPTGHVINDSSRILRFVERQLGKTLFYPEDAAGRARVVALEEKADSLYWICQLVENNPENFSNYNLHFTKQLGELSKSVWKIKALKFVTGSKFANRKIQEAVYGSIRGKIADKERSGGAHNDLLDLTFDETVERLRANCEEFGTALAALDTAYLSGTDSPGAADFALFGQLHRVLGDSFGAFGCGAFPMLLSDPSVTHRVGLQRLLKWWTAIEAAQATDVAFNTPRLRFPLAQYATDEEAGLAAPTDAANDVNPAGH